MRIVSTGTNVIAEQEQIERGGRWVTVCRSRCPAYPFVPPEQGKKANYCPVNIGFELPDNRRPGQAVRTSILAAPGGAWKAALRIRHPASRAQENTRSSLVDHLCGCPSKIYTSP
jgi:hypothetical protein